MVLTLMTQLLVVWAGMLYSMILIFPIPFIHRAVDVVTAYIVTAGRLFSGVFVAQGVKNCKRPKKTLKLYEYEACGQCKKVRETMTALDLDVLILPCPRESWRDNVIRASRYRKDALDAGKRLQFPMLVDDESVYFGSNNINAHLWKAYGDKASPHIWDYIVHFSPVYYVASLYLGFLTIFRPLPEMGMFRTPSDKPKKPLDLWGYEGDPFTKLVRERLSTLELPYIMHSMGKGSTKRDEFFQKHGHIELPYLVDANAGGADCFGDERINDYLDRTYRMGLTLHPSLVKSVVSEASSKIHIPSPSDIKNIKPE